MPTLLLTVSFLLAAPLRAQPQSPAATPPPSAQKPNPAPSPADLQPTPLNPAPSPASPVSSPTSTDAIDGLLLEPNWAERLFANDSRAEVCIYDATGVVGLASRAFPIRITTRPVTLERETYAPLQPPFGDTPTVQALLLDWSADIPDAGAGEQHQRLLASTNRSDPLNPIRLDVSILEPRGLTYKTFQFWKLPPLEVYHSTIPGFGNGERPLPWTTTDPRRPIPEDLLPLLLRAAVFVPGRVYRLQILASERHNRTETPQVLEAEITCARTAQPVPLPLLKDAFRPDQFREYRILRADGLRAACSIAESPPNRLLAWETNDGLTLRLTRAAREE